MDLVDWMGQLTTTPVFGAMHHTTRTGHHAFVTLYHGRNLFTLVRVDQEHDFVMSHCFPFWMKSRRIPCHNGKVPLPITATRLAGVARGCGVETAPTLVRGEAHANCCPTSTQAMIVSNFRR